MVDGIPPYVDVDVINPPTWPSTVIAPPTLTEINPSTVINSPTLTMINPQMVIDPPTGPREYPPQFVADSTAANTQNFNKRAPLPYQHPDDRPKKKKKKIKPKAKAATRRIFRYGS